MMSSLWLAVKYSIALLRLFSTTTLSFVCCIIKAGSSPHSLESVDGVTSIVSWTYLPPKPLEITPILLPCDSKYLQSAITIGVFPLPPTVMLPTTMTGTSAWLVLKMPTL